MMIVSKLAPTKFDWLSESSVEKRHDNVKRTVETLSERGIITFPQIEETLIRSVGLSKNTISNLTVLSW